MHEKEIGLHDCDDNRAGVRCSGSDRTATVPQSAGTLGPAIGASAAVIIVIIVVVVVVIVAVVMVRRRNRSEGISDGKGPGKIVSVCVTYKLRLLIIMINFC